MNMKWVKPSSPSSLMLGDVLVEAGEMVLQNTCCHIRAAVINSTQFHTVPLLAVLQLQRLR